MELRTRVDGKGREMDGTRARSLLRAVAVGLVLATFFVIAQPAQADAPRRVAPTTTRCPGSVSLTQTSAYYDMWGNPVLLAAGPRVYRSNCSSGTQIVRVIYRLYRFENGTWIEDRAVWGDGGQNGVSLSPYSNYRFFNWGPSVTSNTAYTVTMYVEWWNTTGSLLGTYAGWYNSQGDYSCELRNGCHRWAHPTLGAGVMVCGPCWDRTYLIT